MPQLALAACIAVVGAAAAAALTLLLARQRQLAEQLKYDREVNMAKFDNLDQDVAAIKAEVGGLADRIEAAVAAASDDSADQAAVDAADAELRNSLAAMRALAQPAGPAEPPAEEPPAEEPTV